MLRKLLIVAIACFVTIATPSAMFTAQAESAVTANDQFAMTAAAATRTPTATSKSNSATKTPTPAASKSKSATKTPTATSKSATKTPTATSKSKTPTAASKSGENRDLNDPKNATAKCNDGTYYHGTSHHGACSNHKGVKEWLKP